MKKKGLGYIYNKHLHCRTGNYWSCYLVGASTSKYEISVAFNTVTIRQFSKIKVLD